MRSLTLVLLLLISVQAALNMGEDAATPPTHHPHHTHHHHHHTHQQQQQQHQRHRTAQQSHSHSNSHSKPGGGGGQHRSPELIPTVDPKLFSKRRYHSPRVLFSDVVPPDSQSAGLAAGAGRDRARHGPGWGDRDPRVRRGAAEQIMHRGEYSVCDSVNHWVSNKTRATDMKGNEVTVLPDVRINNQVKQQLFYETSCRFATTRPSGGGGRGGAGGGKGRGGKGNRGVRTGSGGCRGIDTRFWNSYCTNTHTFVRALTLWQNQITWRYIRINAACVCVISRTSWKG
ncbi:neurotrophin-7 isoform X2 [Sardina pilchardus]